MPAFSFVANGYELSAGLAKVPKRSGSTGKIWECGQAAFGAELTASSAHHPPWGKRDIVEVSIMGNARCTLEINVWCYCSYLIPLTNIARLLIRLTSESWTLLDAWMNVAIWGAQESVWVVVTTGKWEEGCE